MRRHFALPKFHKTHDGFDDAEFVHDPLVVPNREVERHVVTRQVVQDLRIDDADKSLELPTTADHCRVDVAMRQPDVAPGVFRDAVQMPVQERVVGERVRSPELDVRTVPADPADLGEDVVRLFDVLQEVSRVDLVDGVVRERVPIGVRSKTWSTSGPSTNRAR